MQFNFGVSKQSVQQVKQVQGQQKTEQPKTKLTKKYILNGFKITDLTWMRPSDGRNKYEILVRYIDPEQAQTKRFDGSYQKIIKFGHKGQKDFTDPPYNSILREKIKGRISANTDNPLHPNFYVLNILNGPHQDVYENFRMLKQQIFK